MRHSRRHRKSGREATAEPNAAASQRAGRADVAATAPVRRAQCQPCAVRSPMNAAHSNPPPIGAHRDRTAGARFPFGQPAGHAGRAVRQLAALLRLPRRREDLRQPRQHGLHAGGHAAVGRRRAHGEVLISLYANCPPGTGIQFHLFASPHMRTQLRQYANLRVEDEDQAEQAKQWGRPGRNDNLFRKLARQRVGHLLQGAQTVADRRLPLHDPRLPADDERRLPGDPRT
jgi:hypothetical protein